MASQTLSLWYQRVVRQVRKEPKKAAVVGMLAVAMGSLWGKALLTGKTAPAAASASSAATAAVVAEVASIASAQMTQAAKELEQWTHAPIMPTRRGLFSIRFEYFPQDGSRVAAAETPAAEGFWDELAKLLSAKADQEKARRILAENLKARAEKLDLQSTIMSSEKPKALVNGMLVSEGDTIDGFRVLRIESRRMIVEREGVKLDVLFNSNERESAWTRGL